MFQQQQQQQQVIVEENMSNLTSASGEASGSSGNRTEIGTNYPPQQYFASSLPSQSQTQPPAKKKRNLPGNPGFILYTHTYIYTNTPCIFFF